MGDVWGPVSAGVITMGITGVVLRMVVFWIWGVVGADEVGGYDRD